MGNNKRDKKVTLFSCSDALFCGIYAMPDAESQCKNIFAFTFVDRLYKPETNSEYAMVSVFKIWKKPTKQISVALSIDQ